VNGAIRCFVLLSAGFPAACSDDPTRASSVSATTHGPWSVVCGRTVDEPGARGLHHVHYRVTVSAAGGPAAELVRADVAEGRDPDPSGSIPPHVVLRDWKADEDRVWLLIEQDLLSRVRAYSLVDGTWKEVLTSDVICRNTPPRLARSELNLMKDGRGVDGVIAFEDRAPIAFHFRIEDGKLVSK